MNCPTCKTHMRVIDSREKTGYHYRRYECRECGVRWRSRDELIGKPKAIPSLGLSRKLFGGVDSNRCKEFK
jgi:hypothetical protein